MSCGNSVSKVTGISGVKSQWEVQELSLRHHCIQTGHETHPASYLVGACGSFLGGKMAKNRTGHLLHLASMSRIRGSLPQFP